MSPTRAPSPAGELARPAWTVLSLFRRAVVALDVLGRMTGLAPGRVMAYVEEHHRRRGVPRVDAALRLVDPRALSTGETRLRLLWVLDAGPPPPE